MSGAGSSSRSTGHVLFLLVIDRSWHGRVSGAEQTAGEESGENIWVAGEGESFAPLGSWYMVRHLLFCKGTNGSLFTGVNEQGNESKQFTVRSMARRWDVRAGLQQSTSSCGHEGYMLEHLCKPCVEPGQYITWCTYKCTPGIVFGKKHVCLYLMHV